MGTILRPGSNDADFAHLMTDRVPVELQKVTSSQDSTVLVGSTKKGILREPLATGRSADFQDQNMGKTSEVQKISIDDIGRLSFQTTTSVYNVISGAPEHRQASLLYLRRGYLDFDEKMPDGFYDGGRYLEFEKKEDGTLQPITPNDREIITTDMRKDEGLKRKFEMARDMLENTTDPKQRVLMLAQFVSNILGGIQVVNNQDAADASDAEVESWKRKYGNTLLLGYLNHGVCRHRAILFKYLADRLGIRSRLVRGDSSGAHVWNVVDISGEQFVVDVMKNPFKLFHPDDTEVNYYKRKDGSNMPTGTVGGRSIPVK